MYLVDVNVLVYAANCDMPHHTECKSWLDRSLAGHPQSVALPWPALLGFMRLTSDRRIFPASTMTVAEAWNQAQLWMDAPAGWVPVPGPRHRWFLSELIEAIQPTAKHLSDLHLAALALENGLSVVSVDADFGRLPGVRWMNPVKSA